MSRARATDLVLAGALLMLPLLTFAQGSAQAFRSGELYRQACDDGDMVACNLFGVMYETGEGVTRDLERAVSLYRQACAGAELGGCTNLGLMYEAGAGVVRDAARAAGLYRVACEGGETLGCDLVAALEQTARSELAGRFSKTGRVGERIAVRRSTRRSWSCPSWGYGWFPTRRVESTWGASRPGSTS